MKYLLNLICFFCLLFFINSCQKEDEQKPEENEAKEYKISINFEYGADLSPTAWSNIYVVWLENKNANFIQNVSICQKLIDGGLTGTALPFWKLNVYPSSATAEVDAVTGATQKNKDFTVSADVKDKTVREFTLYFETDRSFNPNDWFTDQPALLYAVDINLDDNKNSYELLPVGWTPNEKTENAVANTPMGTLQNEMQYITHHKNGDVFGDIDDRGAIKMVEKITATIEKL